MRLRESRWADGVRHGSEPGNRSDRPNHTRRRGGNVALAARSESIYDTAERTVDVDLTDAFRCAKHAVPRLRESDQGWIVNISSIGRKMPYPNRMPYAPAKIGLIGLNRALAAECGDDGVTVNAICPGGVRGERHLFHPSSEWGCMGSETDGGDDPLTPTLEHAFDIEVEVDDPIEIGQTGDGQRRIIEIVGGTVTGRIEGELLSGGADYQLSRIERPTELVAKYAFETDSGSRVYVENRGIRSASPETSRRLREGQPVDPDDVYFRTVPEFETADPGLAWLTENVFVAAGIRRPYGVRLAVYRIG